MEMQKTHISLSGKRVPCGARKRPCPRKGHQMVAVAPTSVSIVAQMQYNAKQNEQKDAFIADLRSGKVKLSDFPPTELSERDKKFVAETQYYAKQNEQKNAFIASIKEERKVEREKKADAAGRKAKGSKWDRMTPEEQALFTAQQRKEDDAAFRASAYAKINDPIVLSRLVAQASAHDSVLFEIVAKHPAANARTLQRIFHRNLGNKKLYNLILANPNASEETKAGINSVYSLAK